MHRRARGAWPIVARGHSRGEAYPGRDTGDVGGAHPLGAELGQPRASRGSVGHQRGDVDGLARRRERAEPRDAFVQQHARAVKVSLAPVVEADADLEDAVIQAAVRRPGVSPEELEGLVLLEELAVVELRDALDELGRRWLVAASPDRLEDLPAGDALRRSGRLPVAATRRRASIR
jgi:hypothetical protein